MDPPLTAGIIKVSLGVNAFRGMTANSFLPRDAMRKRGLSRHAAFVNSTLCGKSYVGDGHCGECLHCGENIVSPQ